MNDHFYNKQPWRETNLQFLKKVFPNGLSGSYIELIGGISDKFSAKTEMYHLMKKANLISSAEQFIGVDIDPVVLINRIERHRKDHEFPLFFGDVNDVINKIRRSNGEVNILNRERGISVNNNIQVFNFDTENAIKYWKDGGDKNWWHNNAEYLRIYIREALKKNETAALILNFTRDRGGDSSEEESGPEYRVKLLIRNAKEVFSFCKFTDKDLLEFVDQNRTEGRKVYMATLRLKFKVTSLGSVMSFGYKSGDDFVMS